MQRITEELIRKRCEHNDREIGTLEEIALHQESIGKLEHIQHWCKELKILLMQNNLISKIEEFNFKNRLENLGKLKKLEYLNLALNNITKIENLEGCESLEKLDFTVNFIGELTSVASLKNNIHLHTLFLTGNPCADYEGYRDYVIATLPQLKQLDGKDILVSDRIKALQKYGEIVPDIIKQQNVYLSKWYKSRSDRDIEFDFEGDTDEEDEENDMKVKKIDDEDENFWKKTQGHSPEVRIELAKRIRAQEKAKQPKKPPKKKPPTFFAEDGRPYNINQARIPFTLDDDYWNCLYTLDVAVYKHLDTALIDADVNPFYVRVLIKGKVLQLRFDEEVSPDRAEAKRSQTTGHLVITIPKVKEIIRPPRRSIPDRKTQNQKDEMKQKDNKREYLEVEGKFDLIKALTISRENSTKFIDDPEVPPLE